MAETPLYTSSSANLSQREREVLEVASLGRTNSEIAHELGLTIHTVKFHLASVYRKLDAVNRTDAIVRFIHMNSATSQMRTDG